MGWVEEGQARTPTGVVLSRHSLGRRIGDVLATTDHKMIGYLYLATSFVFFLVRPVRRKPVVAEVTNGIATADPAVIRATGPS